MCNVKKVKQKYLKSLTLVQEFRPKVQEQKNLQNESEGPHGNINEAFPNETSETCKMFTATERAASLVSWSS